MPESLNYFITLLGWSLQGLAVFWPVTLLVMAIAAVAAIIARRRGAAIGVVVAWQLALLVVPLAVLALGALYRCENCTPDATGVRVKHLWALQASTGFLAAEVLFGAVRVWLARGVRLLSGAVFALVFWYSCWAMLIAGMSLSGDWL